MADLCNCGDRFFIILIYANRRTSITIQHGPLCMTGGMSFFQTHACGNMIMCCVENLDVMRYYGNRCHYIFQHLYDHVLKKVTFFRFNKRDALNENFKMLFLVKYNIFIFTFRESVKLNMFCKKLKILQKLVLHCLLMTSIQH